MKVLLKGSITRESTMQDHEIFQIDFLAIPIPQRINLLLLLGCWLWYLVIRIYVWNNVDIVNLISLDRSSSKEAASDHSYSTNNNVNNITTLQLSKLTYNFNLKLTKVILPLHIVTSIFWIIEQTYMNDIKLDGNDIPKELSTDGYSTLASWAIKLCHMVLHTTKILPLIQTVFISYYVLRNCNIIFYCVKRLIFIESTPRNLRTTYILLSDSLTSYAKPLIDFTIYNSILITGDIKFSHLDLLVACIPVFIRIFQCLREFINSNGMDKTHLYNSMKYASGLPVLILMWISRAYPDYNNEYQLNFLQKLFMFINSTFSFYWDLRKDWAITSLSRIRTSPVTSGKVDAMANKKINFPYYFYYLSMTYDFLVRYWWCWIVLGGKLGFDFTSSMIFDGEVQYLEILRRAIWIVFRLESDYISKPTIK